MCEEATFIVGGGPSARALDLDAMNGRGTIIVINDGFKRIPWADACFTADGAWLRLRAVELASFDGHCVAATADDYPYLIPAHVERVRLLHGVGISLQRDHVWFANNSGFAALSWAFAMGLRRIALIGFDLNPQGGHWHDGYEWKSRIGPAHYPAWRDAFDCVAPAYAALGGDIVNCSPKSTIKGFRFASFDDALTGDAWNA